MLTLALHGRYQRTCSDCGYTWVLTRREAQYRARPHVARNLRGLPAGGVQGYYRAAGLGNLGQDVEQQAELAQQFTRCAQCGSTSFRQRPVTRSRPPDPTPHTSIDPT